MAYYTTDGKKLPVTDHIPIILELSHSPLLVKDTPKYNYNRANWEAFTENMKDLQIPNIVNMNTSDIDKHWDTLCKHIITGADQHIPKTRYTLIPSLTMSTKTKNLLKIYNDRYTLYKHNMTNDKNQILANIKRHINSSKSEDLCSFWFKKMKELEEFKLARDPRNFFKNVKNLMGKNNFNLGTNFKHNNIEIHDSKQQADLLAETWEKL